MRARRLLPLLALVFAVLAAVLLGGHRPGPPPEAPRLGARPPTSRPAPPPAGAPRLADAAPSGASGTASPPATGRATRGAPVVPGRVVGPDGFGVAGAAVEVRPLDPRALRGGRPAERAPIATGLASGDGSFEIPVAWKGGWLRVVARAPGRGVGTAWVPEVGVPVEVVCPAATTLAVLALGGDEAPVAGARVAVDVGRTRIEGETGADGRAVLADVPAGAAWVRVETEEGAEGEAGPLAAAPGASVRVVVWVRASVRLSGRVLDAATNLPVAGAEVHVARPGTSRPAGTTGADGRFGPVPAGPAGARVQVAVRAQGYVPRLEPVLLPAGDAPFAVEIAVEPGDAWEGTVVDAEGRPVEGARVSTTDDGIAGREAPAVSTDAQGRFALPPPPPPAPGRRVVLVARAAAGEAARALRPGEEAPADLVLVLGHGRAVVGRVTDESGAPLGRVAVRLEPLWGAMPRRANPGPAISRLLAAQAEGTDSLQAVSRDDGGFRVPDVPDGKYAIRLVRAAGEALVPDPVEVAGAPVDVGALVLPAGYALEGRVTARGVGPLGGVELTCVSEGPKALVRRTQTDETGVYRFDHVPGGEVRVQAAHPLYRAALRAVEIPETTVLDFDLDEGATLAGVVREDDAPYEGLFEVQIESADGRPRRFARTTHRDPEGRFERRGLPDGRFVVRVTTPDGRTAVSEEVVVGTAGRWEVALPLAAASTVHGRLRTAEGGPVSMGHVAVRSERDQRRHEATTDGRGRFAFPSLAPGPYVAVAWGTGGAPTESVFDLPPGTALPLDLDLLPAGAVAVAIVDPRDRPVAQAILLARRPGEPFLGPPDTPVRTDASGRAVLEDLPTGTIEVVARATDGRTVTGAVEVRANQRASVEMALPAGGDE